MDAARLRLCRARLCSGLPLVGGWLRRRAARELAADGSAEAAQALAEAVARSRDAGVRTVALSFLDGLREPAGVDAACGVWAATRHPDLSGLVARHGWIARTPPEVYVLTALHVGRGDLLACQAALVVAPLLAAARDADPALCGAAREVLLRLDQPEARDEVCRHAAREDHGEAWEVALAAGYLPRDDVERALLLFLSEQWERYEAVDFDRRLLRIAYESADAALRQRVMERLRRSGRTDFLTVVAGHDFRARAGVMTDREADFLVQMLAGTREWARLWDLAFGLSLAHSVRILQTLRRAGWQPEATDERALFEELAALSGAEMVFSEAEARRTLPPAAQRARARMPARANGVAFSPARPVIAIGTSQRQVVLWDFQRAQRERVITGFRRSVGRVAFADGGLLLCGERTNRTDVPCTLFAWLEDSLVPLAEHRGSITAIEPAGAGHFLAAGRDQRVTLWDAAERRLVREATFRTWPRSLCASSDGERAALLHAGVSLVSLPQMEFLAESATGWWSESGRQESAFGSGVGRTAVFAPDGRSLIIGKRNGETMLCVPEGNAIASDLLLRHEGAVEGVAVLPERPALITAGSDGRVRFTSWESREELGHVQAPGERLTSMQVSPDGSFMALGDSDASMTLWDLRVLDVPGLIGRPLARALPIHLVGIGALLAEDGIPEPARQSLRFLERLLRHRFRYDIEIDEMPTIQVGEFDIEIEDIPG